ncbi:MAG TPA: sulfatase [Polyangiaceae bacterium]|nr:sulfatase [Polyangiaceae bacterium]
MRWSLWALPIGIAVGCSSAEPSVETRPPVAGQVRSAATKPPNIVFILADDLDEGVFNGASRLKSLLVDQGTLFANHLVTISLCCPSRVATLRGQFAHNSGIFSNGGANGGFGKVFTDGLESSTVPTWLQTASYRTTLIGKYLNGYPNGAPSQTYIPPGWTRWFSPNGGNPYTEYNYDLNENGSTVSYGNTAADYLVDVIDDKAGTFIRNTTANFPNKPFFLYVAPYVPHAPATPPPRYADDFPNAAAPRTPSFNEADVSDKPAWIRNKPLLTDAQIQKIDALYRKRRQTTKAIADLVSDVIDALTATGQLDNTYIFFASDNGFHQGQHRLASGKNTAYDEDLRVPLVVRGPGVPAGATITALTANVDYAATWAELAGVATPAWVDGRSLVPFLQGRTPSSWRKCLLLEHAGPSITLSSSDGTLEPPDDFDEQAQATGGAPVFVGIRTETRTYVEYDTGERELYDLTTDPNELNNGYDSAPASLKNSLSSWVASLKNAAGSALRSAEQGPP